MSYFVINIIKKPLNLPREIKVIIYFKNNSFDSAIASFKEVSASSVNWFVDCTIFRYGFCDVVKYEIKLAQ